MSEPALNPDKEDSGVCLLSLNKVYTVLNDPRSEQEVLSKHEISARARIQNNLVVLPNF